MQHCFEEVQECSVIRLILGSVLGAVVLGFEGCQEPCMT